MDQETFTKYVFYVMKTNQTGPRQYSLEGKEITRAGLQTVLSISRNKFDRLDKWVEAGHIEPPKDLRRKAGAVTTNSRLCEKRAKGPRHAREA